MKKDAKIYVAGHTGLVGSAVVKRLQQLDYNNLCFREEAELDLTDARATRDFFENERPEYVVLAAAKVGGIFANNTYPADFIRINLQIQTHVIESCHQTGVKKLLFLGSSCIYPKHAPQPMCEEHLLTGPLEPTNDGYAIAKIAGIVMCKSYNRQHGTNYVAAMPTNLYGPGDNFDLRSSHVLPAMIAKFHLAKEAQQPSVELWGSGKPRREFLFVEDLADGLVFLLEHYDVTPSTIDDFPFVNIGVGKDISIAELAQVVQRVVGYQGDIVWNKDMPDGTPQKLLNVDRLDQLGWSAVTSLEEGIGKTYDWFLENAAKHISH